MKTHPARRAECPHHQKNARSDLRISRNYRTFATSYRDELQRKQPHQTTGFVLRSESRFRFGRGRASAPPRGGRPGTMRLWHSAPRPSGRAGSLARARTARVLGKLDAPSGRAGSLPRARTARVPGKMDEDVNAAPRTMSPIPPWGGLWPWSKAPSEARGGRIGTLRLMHSASRPCAGKSLRHMPSSARNYEH